MALRSADDPEPLIAVGRAAGEITREPIGDNGFGFDPVMFLPQFGKTFAQLPPEVKNAQQPSRPGGARHAGADARAVAVSLVVAHPDPARGRSAGAARRRPTTCCT